MTENKNVELVLQHPAVGCILDYGCDRCDGA